MYEAQAIKLYLSLFSLCNISTCPIHLFYTSVEQDNFSPIKVLKIQQGLEISKLFTSGRFLIADSFISIARSDFIES